MGKFLDNSGLSYFWGKVKTWATGKFVAKETGKGLSTNDYTTAEKEKLAGLSKVTVDEALSDTSANPVQNKAVQAALGAKLDANQKGAANGVAELDAAGKVPAAQLPSYVDDVVEGYVADGKLYGEEAHATEITCESGKIYVDLATNKTYRWSGSALAEISASLALGETEATAYRGDRGKIAYEHSQAAHAPANAQANVIEKIQVGGQDVEIADKTVNLDLSAYQSEAITTEEIDAIIAS
ncbi:MAG: hypothetical protein Q4C73_09475 [Eubacteriales bacterium]|nr:hypothetical protein [Eubacteriales bacterium]